MTQLARRVQELERDREAQERDREATREAALRAAMARMDGADRLALRSLLDSLNRAENYHPSAVELAALVRWREMRRQYARD